MSIMTSIKQALGVGGVKINNLSGRRMSFSWKPIDSLFLLFYRIYLESKLI
jgi:uncharacterized membrane protein (UPF0182 family)